MNELMMSNSNTRTHAEVQIVAPIATALPRIATTPTCAITVRPYGDGQWRVRYPESGKVKRKFFDAEDKANAFAAELRGDTISNRKRLSLLPQADADALMLIYNHIQQRGIPLHDALKVLHHSVDAPKPSPALSVVIDELLKTKESIGLKTAYIASVRQVLRNFEKGIGQMPVALVTVDLVESFLNQYSARNRTSLRARLSSVFRFSLRKGYIRQNPCDRLETVKVAYVPPQVMTKDEVVKALKYLKKHPRAMAWFVLSCFVGLRPSEAERITWNEIDFDERIIKVEAGKTKTGQHRVIHPMRMAFKWLKVAARLKSELPLSHTTLRRELRALRGELGWPEWKQDVTRHTAASYWLAEVQSTAGVAMQLGNSERMLRKHYMALVTRKQAEAFWKLTPVKVLESK